MTVIAGLDTGTTSGVGILSGDRLMHAEAFRPKGDGDPAIFNGFRTWWRAILVAHEVTEVAIEEPLRTDLSKTETQQAGDAFGGRVVKVKKPIGTMRTFLRLYGIRAHAIEVCAALSIPCREVNVQNWRDKIHGTRRAPKGTPNATAWWKGKALERCQLLGWPVKSKDAAEGALIAEYLRITLKEERLGISVRPDDLFAGAA